MAISQLELQDAFIGLCATVDANYSAQTTKNALGDYMKNTMMLEAFEDVTNFSTIDATTDAEALKEIKALAAAGAKVRFVRAFDTYLLVKLRLLEGFIADAGAIGAIVALVPNMTFQVSVEKTQNLGGVINISGFDIRSKTDEAIMFALVHEFGHSVDFALRVNYPAVVQQILDGYNPMTASAHDREYFADAFAAMFLKAAGKGNQWIHSTADALFGNEPNTADHPAGMRRLKNVAGQLTTWGEPKYDVTSIADIF